MVLIRLCIKADKFVKPSKLKKLKIAKYIKIQYKETLGYKLSVQNL